VMIRTVDFYKTAGGKCTVKDFLDSLSGQAVRKVTWVLKLVEDMEQVPAAYFKKLTDSEEIWECRVASGSNSYRLFCFFAGNSLVVLTHGFVKKTGRVPRGEIEKAERYRRDFLIRRRKT
jgi:phage-related protein